MSKLYTEQEALRSADQLRAAWDDIEEYGWHKGGTYDYYADAAKPPACIQGATIRACGHFMSLASITAVCAAANRLFPERGYPWGTAAMVNDHRETSFEDMALIVKHAANDLEYGEI